MEQDECVYVELQILESQEWYACQEKWQEVHEIYLVLSQKDERTYRKIDRPNDLSPFLVSRVYDQAISQKYQELRYNYHPHRQYEQGFRELWCEKIEMDQMS